MEKSSIKLFIGIMFMTLTACFFTSCSDDDDTSSEIDIPTNGSDNNTLQKAEQEYKALASLLKYNYICFPIKANPLQLQDINITIEGQNHAIGNVADIIQHGDYELLIYPKDIKNTNDIAFSLEKETPTCLCKISEITSDAEKYICCTMPDIDEKWCLALCGNQSPVEVLNEINDEKEGTNDETGENDSKKIGKIQKLYKEKTTTLNMKYTITKAKLFNNQELQKELQAIYERTMEDMKSYQADILKDLVEANEKWKNSRK